MGPVVAGPAAYSDCQAGCASVIMACYSAAGFTWGATVGASAPASILAAYGTCQSCLLVLPYCWIQRLTLNFCRLVCYFGGIHGDLLYCVMILEIGLTNKH